jgi:hypothetical protein
MVAQVRVLQIIVAALAAGAAMFLFFTLSMELFGPRAAPHFGVVSQAMSALAVGVLVMHRLLPRLMLAQVRRSLVDDRSVVGDALRDRLLAVRQGSTIAGAALCEGASFGCSVAYSMEGHLAMAVTSAVAIVLALSFFPTVARTQAWLDEESRAIEEFRQFR